ncbi:hypothetical protein THTE_3801 [Thermogutta terrifontis]|uniref:Uncharacterized protein n=1 Tax=Thermogutta terrifontis TaxID=1331910 RepID=A0A286RKE2_9BACT|nr:hypothetical protein THTE_3801 [Thermogutta terrifontis]
MVLLSLAAAVRVSPIVTPFCCVYHMHREGSRKEQFDGKVISDPGERGSLLTMRRLTLHGTGSHRSQDQALRSPTPPGKSEIRIVAYFS